MKSYFFITVGILGLIVLPQTVSADFSFYWRDSNYFNAHYRAYNTLDLDKERSQPAVGVGNTMSFSSFQLRMKPSISITDRVSIHAGFDVFSSAYNNSAHEGGALQGEQAGDTTQVGPQAHANLTRQFFGATNGYGHSALTTTGRNNFLVRDAFLEYISDWGILKIGRVPRDWGLGIRYHAGEGVWDKFSDRTDSLFYELGLGNFKLAGIHSKVSEGSLDKNKDDANYWEGYLKWNHPVKDVDAGLLYTFMSQSSTFLQLSVFDLYVKKKFSEWVFGAEGVLSMGAPGRVAGNKAEQIGLATEVVFSGLKNVDLSLKSGYASGTDLGRVQTLTVFPFNRNYHIAMLLFNQGLGNLNGQTGIAASPVPDINTIFNAYYLNPRVHYTYNDRVGAEFSYAAAVAPFPVTPQGNKIWGQETDLKVSYLLLKNMNLDLLTGIFFPGGLYRGTPGMAAQALDFAYGGEAMVSLVF